MKTLPPKNSWKLLITLLTASMTLGVSAQKAPSSTNPSSPTSTSHSSTIPLIQEWKALGDSPGSMDEVSYEAIPLTDVANHLRTDFRKRGADFDVLIPREAVIPKSGINVQSVPVSLSLKNVNA